MFETNLLIMILEAGEEGIGTFLFYFLLRIIHFVYNWIISFGFILNI